MDGFINEAFDRLINNTDTRKKRFLFDQFKPSRLTGLVGPRGVGKTTLMLQYIKQHLNERAFYFSADAVYFRQTTLLEYIDDLYKFKGIRHFFVDEIHKYNNWNQELKNLYDAFPDIQIVYSGSSMLEIVKGSYDLSRRTQLYHLPGMSFREYLNFKTDSNYSTVDFKKILNNSREFTQLSQIDTLMGHFKSYLETGYYPFVFEEPHIYHERVTRVIDKIISEDIPSYFDLKTQNLPIFKRTLSFLASIPPGEVNTNNIAKNLQVSHQTISHYLSILESVGLIQIMYPFEGGNQHLRKPQKIFLHNTSLLYTLQQTMGEPINKGTLRELYFIQALRDAKENVFYSQIGDYQTKDHVFEIGGKNKKHHQIKDSKLKAYLVKDDILSGNNHTIPIWLLGFLY